MSIAELIEKLKTSEETEKIIREFLEERDSRLRNIINSTLTEEVEEIVTSGEIREYIYTDEYTKVSDYINDILSSLEDED